jgi:putative spermidine/putrescine transport system permease protein
MMPGAHPAATAPGDRAGYLLSLPATLFLLLCLAVPVLSVLVTSFAGAGPPEDSWSLAQYAGILGSGYYRLAFLRTLALGGGIAGICLVLAIPLGYWTLRHPAWRSPLLIALTGPMMVNVVARLYGWQLLLSDSGPVNRLLGFGEPVMFVGSMLGVAIVMVHVMLPYAAIPIFNSMRAIDPAAIDAAQTLGASPWRVFRFVVVPQSLPGIITGFVLVFTLSAASFVVPAVMGGGRVNTFATLTYQEMMALDFPRAAALAACLLVVLLPLAWLSRRAGRQSA